MRRNVLGVVLISLGSLLLTSCEPTETYIIEVTPQGDQLERSLTYSKSGSATQPATAPATQSAPTPDLEAEQVERLKTIYTSYERVHSQHVFRGTFKDVPADTGGAGTYYRMQSPLGDAYAYIERFRGDDQPAKLLTQEWQKVDELVDLLIGWFSIELKDDPGLPTLKTFLDTQFRQDLKDLAVYSWLHWNWPLLTSMATTQPAGSDPESLQARVLLFAQERRYIAADEVPAITRAVKLISEDQPEEFLAIIQRKIAQRMGVATDQPVPQSLEFLAATQPAQQSFEDYLRSTPQYQKLLADWQAEQATKPAQTSTQPAEPPSPLQVIPNVNLLPLGSIGPDGNSVAGLQLDVPVGPYLTNGSYNEEKGWVEWQTVATAQADHLPGVFFALWSVPNEKFQMEHLGDAILYGDSLAQWALWYNGLTSDEKIRIDQLLAGLQGTSSQVMQQLQAATQPADESQTQPYRFEDDGIKDLIHAAKAAAEAAAGRATTQPKTKDCQ